MQSRALQLQDLRKNPQLTESPKTCNYRHVHTNTLDKNDNRVQQRVPESSGNAIQVHLNWSPKLLIPTQRVTSASVFHVTLRSSFVSLSSYIIGSWGYPRTQTSNTCPHRVETSRRPQNAVPGVQKSPKPFKVQKSPKNTSGSPEESINLWSMQTVATELHLNYVTRTTWDSQLQLSRRLQFDGFRQLHCWTASLPTVFSKRNWTKMHNWQLNEMQVQVQTSSTETTWNASASIFKCKYVTNKTTARWHIPASTPLLTSRFQLLMKKPNCPKEPPATESKTLDSKSASLPVFEALASRHRTSTTLPGQACSALHCRHCKKNCLEHCTPADTMHHTFLEHRKWSLPGWSVLHTDWSAPRCLGWRRQDPKRSSPFS